MKLAGAVVLYNVSVEVIDILQTYASCLDRLYVVDNSDVPNEQLYGQFESMSNVKLFKTEGNMGIAVALNKAAYQAIRDGYEWLLLMDHDSSFQVDVLEEYKRRIEEDASQSVAIYAPSHFQMKKGEGETERFVHEAITSGSIISLKVFTEVGPFKEEYFIYVVDYEYCWRVRAKGYQVKQFLDIRLDHQLNDTVMITTKTGEKKVKNVRVVSDSAFYYAFRNTAYLLREYASILPEDVKNRRKDFFLVWNYHAVKSKRFFHKISFGLRGLRDSCRNVTGKLKL